MMEADYTVGPDLPESVKDYLIIDYIIMGADNARRTSPCLLLRLPRSPEAKVY